MHNEKWTEHLWFLALRAIVVTLIVVLGLMLLRNSGIIGSQTDLSLGQVETYLGENL